MLNCVTKHLQDESHIHDVSHIHDARGISPCLKLKYQLRYLLIILVSLEQKRAHCSWLFSLFPLWYKSQWFSHYSRLECSQQASVLEEVL